MKRYWPFAMILLGMAIAGVGFVYDVLFAGIPYQDPTPAMVARYNFHSQIASTLCWGGVGIFFMGGAAAIVRKLLRKGRVIS